MRIDDGEITARLEEIRKQVGGRKVDFIPPPPPGTIDSDIDPRKVKDLFDGGILTRDGQPVFVYIRDHSFQDHKNRKNFPEDGYKIHFAVCQTLTNMKKKGRYEARYRITSRDNDRYLIDVGNKEKEVPLFPCWHCLSNVDYRCFNSMDDHTKQKIREEFKAKQAFELLWQQFVIFKRQTKGLSPASLSAWYSKYWRFVSEKYRKSRNYTCEECGVRLGNYRRCVDTHHKNADKTNSRYDNLACLCKLCHAKEHPHYRVSPECRRIIEEARGRQQGILL